MLVCFLDCYSEHLEAGLNGDGEIGMPFADLPYWCAQH